MSGASEEDNKAMKFLKKIGRVGGSANMDFAGTIGSDEGSMMPQKSMLTATTAAATAAAATTTSFANNPKNMICPELSLESPTVNGNEIAVVACG